MKFFSCDEPNELKPTYKVKLPSELVCMDFSSDGNHYAVGLNSGSLLIKSKSQEKVDEQDEEEKLMNFE